MSDLIEFLCARLDEDEAAIGTKPDPSGYCDALQGVHLSPTRARRDVAAKRSILNGRWGGPDHEDMWQFVMEHLVAVYCDHPDYDPKWRPGE